MIKQTKKYFGFVFSTLLITFTSSVFAKNIDEQVSSLLKDQAALASGEKNYGIYCAACHKKDLSGAVGFNLKDSEWVHGDSAEAVFNNISNGFAQAGMPGFGTMLSEEQRKEIVAFIFSKREGMANIEYKIYQPSQYPNYSFADLAKATPTKQGKSTDNLIHFELAETKEYAIVVTADVYAPNDKDAMLFAKPGPFSQFEVLVDGEPVKMQGGWDRFWQLKKGYQHLTFKMMLPKAPYNELTQTNLDLRVMTPDEAINFFPVSKKAETIINQLEFNIIADKKVVVQRKKVADLPAYSISVGFPSKLNYAFNTKTCSVVGVWKGDFLNVGPNIIERGKSSSLPIGSWVFKSPQVIGSQQAEDCLFTKYHKTDQPTFYFNLNGVDLSLTVKTVNAGLIEFEYQVINAHGNALLALDLPELANSKVAVSANNQSIAADKINLAKTKTFTVTISGI
ncbi:cytochrome c [Catenovulum sp. 2E275]|uniref:c-type cytochrome n=1 Tax=Catenovulum sp. 2E275 TaxID=2980497 RepID=UPI0021D3DAC0|nr:cytochrome c [Catenovulum sp. 2E275]MCU4677101.1 cytochrome c [Catenovulum sp. 2E275]